MKVSFGSKIVEGPWGGGNLFLINLKNYLNSLGHEVVFDLTDEDIDIILFTDPRKGRGSTSNFNHKKIEKYKKKVNQKVKIVQRINECDERKNTTGVNKLYLDSTKVADHVVFVSDWLKNIYVDLGLEKTKSSTIMSGSDKKIFNSQGKTTKPLNSKFNLLTHHWSSNWMKGFELYLFLDKLLEKNYWKNKITFTYIGNIDNSIKFNNTKVIEPLSGHELANEIKSYDIYVTGSINEPSGNHHIEAAMCGLPVLYVDSGGITEYCKDFGLAVDLYNFEQQLDYMLEYFQNFKNKMRHYPYNSETMCSEYLNLFENLIKN